MTRTYVQYHNRGTQGAVRPVGRDKKGQIWTDKKQAEQTLGQRIVLIEGVNVKIKGTNRKHYYLAEAFTATKIELGDDYRYNVSGPAEDRERKRVDDQKWFEDLRRAAGNFAFGLTRITNPRILEGLKAQGPAGHFG